MSVREQRRWCRQTGFRTDHPDPCADLGYDGEALATGDVDDEWFPFDRFLAVDGSTIDDGEYVLIDDAHFLTAEEVKARR